MTDKIWTLREIVQWSTRYLEQSGSETPRLDAELLLCNALNCRRIDLYLDYDKPLNQQERDIYRRLIRRRADHEPVAYILGYKEFYSLRFKVNPKVLIPRPETELLVDLVLSDFPDGHSFSGLDVGTGSGCIAVALKKHRPKFEMEAWDICEDALALAIENSQMNDVVLNCIKKDALNDQEWRNVTSPLDFIVSNPPYISFDEKLGLQRSVGEYEPHGALFAEENGLIFYKKFAELGKKYLKRSGKIFLEIGSTQASAIIEILGQHGWLHLSVHKDLSGSDRVVSARSP